MAQKVFPPLKASNESALEHFGTEEKRFFSPIKVGRQKPIPFCTPSTNNGAADPFDDTTETCLFSPMKVGRKAQTFCTPSTIANMSSFAFSTPDKDFGEDYSITYEHPISPFNLSNRIIVDDEEQDVVEVSFERNVFPMFEKDFLANTTQDTSDDESISNDIATDLDEEGSILSISKFNVLDTFDEGSTVTLEMSVDDSISNEINRLSAVEESLRVELESATNTIIGQRKRPLRVVRSIEEEESDDDEMETLPPVRCINPELFSNFETWASGRCIPFFHICLGSCILCYFRDSVRPSPKRRYVVIEEDS